MYPNPFLSKLKHISHCGKSTPKLGQFCIFHKNIPKKTFSKKGKIRPIWFHSDETNSGVEEITRLYIFPNLICFIGEYMYEPKVVIECLTKCRELGFYKSSF
jgi:hypothetical protein